MNRYITIEKYDGTVTAHAPDEDWLARLRDESVAAWVWQYAESRDQAVDQHYAKHDDWTSDMDAGREAKRTY